MRHPHVLRLVEITSTTTSLIFVSERVTPLGDVLDTLALDERLTCLWQVADALEFLHVTCGQSHGHVSMSDVYMTSEGSWKLGGLETLAPISAEARAGVEADRTAYAELVSAMTKDLVSERSDLKDALGSTSLKCLVL